MAEPGADTQHQCAEPTYGRTQPTGAAEPDTARPAKSTGNLSATDGSGNDRQSLPLRTNHAATSNATPGGPNDAPATEGTSGRSCGRTPIRTTVGPTNGPFTTTKVTLADAPKTPKANIAAPGDDSRGHHTTSRGRSS